MAEVFYSVDCKDKMEEILSTKHILIDGKVYLFIQIKVALNGSQYIYIY
jgi:hypothetical protein